MKMAWQRWAEISEGHPLINFYAVRTMYGFGREPLVGNRPPASAGQLDEGLSITDWHKLALLHAPQRCLVPR